MITFDVTLEAANDEADVIHWHGEAADMQEAVELAHNENPYHLVTDVDYVFDDTEEGESTSA